MRIGEFEAAAKAADPNREPDTFTLNGHEFTVAEDPNIIALGRFARSARAGADSDDMEGLATLVETVASLVIPEDETRFLDTASKHRVDATLLMQIITAVLEAQSARPTVSPSDSSDGSSKITVSSRVLSSSEVRSGPKSWRDTPFGRRELDPETGHPELYEGIGTVEENGRSLSSVG